MNDEHDQIEALLNRALEFNPAERPAFLAGACGGDNDLREKVETLLRAAEEADGFMEGVTTLEPTPLSEGPGTVIGRYKLLQKVGEGGMGVVYMAEQTEPVTRKVALKIIKLGMDTKQVVARFEAERQALAMMDHPNIAKVLDAGATDTGRPYFVMELVRGVPITEYCDKNKLSTQERLNLFIPVCQAIQHAHQKGVIHRDIKPSNVMVTLHDGNAVPKVIDFGIAKATNQKLTEKTLFTNYAQMIGTPAYMSPEQAEMSGLDVDTRTDVYSLGVLLYELLTGTTPFPSKELMSMGYGEMQRIIAEKEPPKPSTRLSTMQHEERTVVAKNRSMEVSALGRVFKGDLDWIVMKALEKDRTHRYETVNGLVADIKRHLNSEPVSAAAPTFRYQLSKFARRNKRYVRMAALVAVLLVIALMFSSYQAIRARQAERVALAAKASESAQREKAVEAQFSEAKLREKAQADEFAARQRAYASDMNVAQQSLAESNLGRAQDLLNRQRPQPGQKDLRGWEWRYLWQQTRSDALFTLCQKSEIESLAASADGRWLAIGLVHKDGLFVYDLQRQREVAHLAPGEGAVRAIFSPANSWLAFTSVSIPAAGQPQTTLHLWNLATRQAMTEMPLAGECEGLAFSQDGRTLATSSSLEAVSLWHMPDGTKLAGYDREQRTVPPPTAGFATTLDLSLAAYGTESGQVRVIDLHSGRELWSAPASKQYVTALAFSPDGKTLASAAGFNESDIRLWDVATGKENGRLEGHQSWVGSLVFWPDGKKLASGSADQSIRIWNVASRRCLDVLNGHRQEVWRLVLLPDNKTLVSAGKDGVVCVWDTSVTHPRTRSITWSDKISSWCFASEGRSVVTLDYEGRVTRWSGADFQRKQNILSITNYNSVLFFPFSVSLLSRDGCFLAVGSTNGIVRVWDVMRGVFRCEFKPAGGNVIPLSFLSRGNHLVCWLRADNRLSEWDLDTNREIQSWTAPSPLRGCGPSTDDRLWVGIGWEGDVSARDLPGRVTTKLPLDILEGWSLAFSADGKRLAATSALGFARVWDTATWREEATLGGFRNGVSSEAFSPDNRRLAIGGSNPDEALTIWDADSWQEVFTLEGTGFYFNRSAFSPDGNAVGTKSSNGILHVWQAPSWAEIDAAEAKERSLGRQP